MALKKLGTTTVSKLYILFLYDTIYMVELVFELCMYEWNVYSWKSGRYVPSTIHCFRRFTVIGKIQHIDKLRMYFKIYSLLSNLLVLLSNVLSLPKQCKI